jgi:hypothetical protein
VAKIEMGGYEERWVAKMEMGGYEEGWVAKKGDGWQSREMGG